MNSRFFAVRFLVVIYAFAAVIIGVMPAFANVTGASISTGTPNYVGPCPATVNFTGSITAAAGTTFTYSLNRFINGAQQIITPAGQPIVIGPSPTPVPVNDSIKISASTSGLTFDQIWVHNISDKQGGHPDVYTTPPSNFKVTCATPSPTFPPNVLKNIISVLPQPPVNLHQTGNAQDCGSHALGFVCPAAMANSWLVLVWCWPDGNACGPTSTSANIKGFNVYQVDNGKHVLVASNSPYNDGTLATGGVVETPAGGFANQCYAATAIMSNGQESGNSNVVCLGNGSVGNVTTTYHATAWATRYQSSQYGNVPFRGLCDLCLGWQHDESSIGGVIQIWWYADNNRAYYRFDLSGISGHYIASATLHVPLTGGNLSCFSAIAAADTDLNGNTDYIGGNFSAPGGSIGTGLDVRDIVRAWVSGGTPNYGFVLRASNENRSPESTTCLTSLGTDATLDVVHS